MSEIHVLFSKNKEEIMIYGYLDSMLLENFFKNVYPEILPAGNIVNLLRATVHDTLKYHILVSSRFL